MIANSWLLIEFCLKARFHQRKLAISNQQSRISNQWFAIFNQQSVICNQGFDWNRMTRWLKYNIIEILWKSHCQFFLSGSLNEPWNKSRLDTKHQGPPLRHFLWPLTTIFPDSSNFNFYTADSFAISNQPVGTTFEFLWLLIANRWLKFSKHWLLIYDCWLLIPNFLWWKRALRRVQTRGNYELAISNHKLTISDFPFSISN
jgi:hypothetical protein